MSLNLLVIVVWFAGPLLGLAGGAFALSSARRTVLPAEEIRKKLRETASNMPT